MTTQIAIKPYGSAPGFSTEPFPTVNPLKVVRSVFARMADPDQPRRRALHPLVYALPLDGIIEHAEQGATIDQFLEPNRRIRSVFGDASANNFRDLAFTLKPSRTTLENGGPDAYLLKVSLPGSSKADWRGLNAQNVRLFAGRQEARVASDKSSEIVTLSVQVDTEAKVSDPGFGEFTNRPARRDGPYVLTFELPGFINSESLIGDTPAIEYPKGLTALDRMRGHLNIVLPVRDGAGHRPVSLPGLSGPA